MNLFSFLLQAYFLKCLFKNYICITSFPLKTRQAMAGAAALSAFMQILFDKLITTSLNEVRSIRNIGKDLQNLSSSLATIQSLLEDAEEKELKNRSVKIWLFNLKNVAYDMDELLDDYEAKARKSKLEYRKNKVSRYFHLSYLSNYDLFFHSKTARKIKEIRERLESIARERDLLGLQELGSMSRVEITKRPQTSSLVDYSKVFGRENDRDRIVSLLLSDSISSSHRVTVLPIVGMGGLGKTTLTQLVYNDDRVKKYFELRMWVYVSDNFDEMKLTKEMIDSTSSMNSAAITGCSTATTNMNLLQVDLKDKLKGKKFLLVLDDVWNEDLVKWNNFRASLISGRKGSKIVVTTQNEKVGNIMRGLPPYRLQRLTDDDCWQLFKSYAFSDGNPRQLFERSAFYDENTNLGEIGIAIVKKLQGLPLAAKVIGSLLYSELDENYWKSILKSEILELPSGKDKILPALRLSYKHLAPHLKQCFTFCSVFPKDYVFEKDTIVQIWMALGFIQPQRNMRLEDIGSSYYDELFGRCFFEKKKENYVMPDAMRNLAQSISHNECQRLEDTSSNPQSVLHMSFSCKDSQPTVFSSFSGYERLRTLLLLRGYKSKINKVPGDLFLRLRHLRVLDLYRRDITELPDSIGTLSQLRYLGLSGTGIKALPPSIGKLYNLQTLKLKNCNDLKHMPNTLSNLISLRHLEASITLKHEIANIGRLTYLQELEEFAVRKDKRYRIKELKNMLHLQGSLCIRNLENVGNHKEANEAMLEDKENISVLELKWASDRYIGSGDKCYDEEVLQGLKPHHELKELTVIGFAGLKFPTWMGSPLFSQLQTIHLSESRRCMYLPPLGQLPSLRYLDITSFGLVKIGPDFEGSGEIQSFPALIEIFIDDMPDLEEWFRKDGNDSFRCLTNVEIVDCPKLKELPCLPAKITKLHISEVGILVLPKFEVAEPILSSLHIRACPNLASLRQGMLSQRLHAMKELRIIDCEELELLPEEGFRQLVSLSILHIYNCPRLGSSPSHGLILPNSVEDLQVTSCNLIKVLLQELIFLPSLRYLKISNCDDVTNFPKEGLPLTLQFLGIIDCTNLQFLPLLRDLNSLETLIIRNCPIIQFLATDGLPGTLQELDIKNCEQLSRYFNLGLHQTSTTHIPRVEIE